MTLSFFFTLSNVFRLGNGGQNATEPKELMIIPNGVHVDLYDRLNKIPFDKLENFFKENLK